MTADAESQGVQADSRERVAFYFDAFNLYYGIVKLAQPHLKWINLYDLSQSLLKKREQRLVKVVFCTAYNKFNYDKLARHQTYVRVLEHFGVTCIEGHYIQEPRQCKSCSHEWRESSEKQTDVNLALHLFQDAHLDLYDHAYLVTADSDQAATAKMLKTIFPKKRLTSVVPPTKELSYHIKSYADGHFLLKDTHLERVVMDKVIMATDAQGRPTLIAKRPAQYDPPAGWVHPMNRP
jgi:hypothetical protein